MHELVVISGKGGTGKTSIVASFASICGGCVVADADVDAPDLHLILEPTDTRREDFSGGSRARIRSELCIGCGTCRDLCRFDAITSSAAAGDRETFQVDPTRCEGCGVCAYFCESDAIEFGAVVNGELLESDARPGPLAHARLGIAEENSGKLVTEVRQRARELARRQGLELIIIDGPPGVGCPVIASLTAASLVLVVTEPTLSGQHDLERVLQLTGQLRVPAAICINKWDLNPELSERIEAGATAASAAVAGRVRYDNGFTSAQLNAQAVVDLPGAAGRDVRQLWANLRNIGASHGIHL